MSTVSSKIIPHNIHKWSSGAAKITGSGTYTTGSGFYSSLPTVTSASTYQTTPMQLLDCSSFNQAIITPVSSALVAVVPAFAIYAIHTDGIKGNTPKFWCASLIHTYFATTVSTSLPMGSHLALDGTTNAMYGFTTPGSITTTAGVGAMYDSIWGTTSVAAGAAGLSSQYSISYLGGADYLAICYNAASIVDGTYFGTLVQLMD